MAKLPLARDFPAADKAAWKALVEQALKGAPFASLESKSYDGIAVEPLYGRASDAAVVPGRAPGNDGSIARPAIERLDGDAVIAFRFERGEGRALQRLFHERLPRRLVGGRKISGQGKFSHL